jgi:hypothetical protein
MQVEQSAHCTYTYQASKDVHELVLLRGTRQAVDEFFAHLDRIREETSTTPADYRVRMIIDITRSGLPPLGYFFSAEREWRRASPHRRSTRNAIIYREGYLLRAVGTLLNVVITPALDATQVFPDGSCDAAYEWLLRDT